MMEQVDPASIVVESAGAQVVESRQELDDISAGLPTKDSIFVLEANDVKLRIVQKIGRLNIFADGSVIDLKPHGNWIVIDAPGICHRNHACLQIEAIERNRPMKVMGESRNSTATRQMITDECNPLKRGH